MSTLTLQTLSDHSEGLIGIAGSPSGILRELVLSSPAAEKKPHQFLALLQATFKDDLFIEIQRYANGPLQGELMFRDLAKGIQNPPARHAGYLPIKNPDEEKLYRTLTAIRHITPPPGALQSDAAAWPGCFSRPGGFSNSATGIALKRSQIYPLSRTAAIWNYLLAGRIFPPSPTPDRPDPGRFPA